MELSQVSLYIIKNSMPEINGKIGPYPNLNPSTGDRPHIWKANIRNDRKKNKILNYNKKNWKKK